jgi:hypothetical protein
MTRTHHTLAAAGAALLLGLATLAMPGCGSAAASPPPLDPATGVAYLNATLEAWKSGRVHGEVLPGPEGLRAADEDWLAGLRLVEFTVDAGAATQDPSGGLRVPATLTLRDPRGRSLKRPVVYQVLSDPTPLVVRSGQ